MRLLDVPPEGVILANGACYLCGTTRQGEPMLDLERLIEFEGHLFFCESCCQDIARLVGFVTPAELEATLNELREVEAERNTLIDTLEDREKLEGLLSDSLDTVRGGEEPAEITA